MALRPGIHAHKSCQERDQIILAFALAANEGNVAAGDLEAAVTDGERRQAQRSVDAARGFCYELRERVLKHCKKHGC